MSLLTGLKSADRFVTQQAGLRIPAHAGRVLSLVEEAAESSKLWCVAAAAMAAGGGGRGRKAAVTGLVALALAQLVSNGVGKQLVDRSRPPKEWFPHDEADDRPDSSSFPSGHTAAAVAFTAGVAFSWSSVGGVCAVPAVVVAVERVQSGAHYPSDVVAGATIGLLSAWFTQRVSALLRRRL
ncbi:MULTISPECIES: phosphatase PAP2 family protein [Streptomyces]|uniref:phosphatase PAP2 family protein n=1 Tax=Streptomyces TaxID=1883 RepID=UPI0028B1F427|nr:MULTISPECIES: phosphatase PAP2 family protein [Streptomyces]MDX2919027.1 phosphatase PAP2 family protein [Streptomyces sp. NE06-03C]MDX3608051.1 phosphatase PAP2 family protein [Streptomyces sp. FL06-04B]MDX3738752.1 phosphatase PAP2 family protein [Streptomyces sp. ID01-15D]